MLATNKNILIVEGKTERYSIPELMDFHTVWGNKPKEWVVEILETNGIDGILKTKVISTASKTPKLHALGVIIDADDKFTARWTQLKSLCEEIAEGFPEELPEEGLIYVTTKGLRIGVWIMPDNSSRGMMETFLSLMLSPECSHIWGVAKKTCSEVSELPNSFKGIHQDKSQIHAYLAWIDPPGQTLPEAIISKAINANSPLAQQFVSWMMNLFELTPRN